jgi:hypothetical protein
MAKRKTLVADVRLAMDEEPYLETLRRHGIEFDPDAPPGEDSSKAVRHAWQQVYALRRGRQLLQHGAKMDPSTATKKRTSWHARAEAIFRQHEGSESLAEIARMVRATLRGKGRRSERTIYDYLERLRNQTRR